MKAQSLSSTNRWPELFEPGQSKLRVVILAAHPDDETLGASAVLMRAPDVFVIYLTDGAPRDKSLWSSGLNCSRNEYAEIRREEAARALSVAGVNQSSIRFLSGVDQEAINELPELTDEFSCLLRELSPSIVVTHSYEGGHPDHDAAALTARLGCESLDTMAPAIVEMASYHARGESVVTGEFLPNEEAPCEIVLHLTGEELSRKKQMLQCYRSQRAVIEAFRIESERFRPVPQYDFTRAPHEGRLWYECMNWPLSGQRWRELAADAIPQLRESLCR